MGMDYTITTRLTNNRLIFCKLSYGVNLKQAELSVLSNV